ncbi:hypothetical protein L6270_02030 [Candidatus Parcubacteria bacterium]|nr:hypothetical protein [Patescibacteria group bacterium]MBU4309434.1 hypothetical protein [Patescibacteria group bacterium]MBU4431916.1 hypothetical protein [Patescibacteria group bacterium]MBU4577795.1 hypothetical protein [Patescibacteria group bacterium]MCG2696788.1 hypothetical protein [Candidatus Parcubacteria bacterium]
MTTDVEEPGSPKIGYFLGTVEIGTHQDGHALLMDVRSHGRVVDQQTAQRVIDIEISPEKKKIHLYAITGKELGVPDDVDYLLNGVYYLAHLHGFKSFPDEVAPLISMQGNGLRPALVASSSMSSHKFRVHGEKLSGIVVGDKTLFTSEDIAIFAYPSPSPGHS